MYLTKYEKETSIQFNEDESTATVYTYNKRFINSLLKVFAPISIVQGGYTFTVPKSWVKPPKPPKKVSENTLIALQKAREQRNNTVQTL